NAAIALANGKEKHAKALVSLAEFGLKLTTITVPILEVTDEKTKNPTLDRVQFEPSSSRPKRKFKVLSRKVQSGQNVDTKEPLFILAAGLDQMQAHALIPESQITRVAIGQEAQFWIDALGDEKKMPATVAEIGLT